MKTFEELKTTFQELINNIERKKRKKRIFAPGVREVLIGTDKNIELSRYVYINEIIIAVSAIIKSNKVFKHIDEISKGDLESNLILSRIIIALTIKDNYDYELFIKQSGFEFPNAPKVERKRRLKQWDYNECGEQEMDTVHTVPEFLPIRRDLSFIDFNIPTFKGDSYVLHVRDIPSWVKGKYSNLTPLSIDLEMEPLDDKAYLCNWSNYNKNFTVEDSDPKNLQQQGN